MKIENEYRTKDFYLSCILLASKLVSLTKLDRSENDFVTFVFNDPKGVVPGIIQSHWDRKHKAISLDLVEAIKQLKTRLHSGV